MVSLVVVVLAIVVLFAAVISNDLNNCICYNGSGGGVVRETVQSHTSDMGKKTLSVLAQ